MQKTKMTPKRHETTQNYNKENQNNYKHASLIITTKTQNNSELLQRHSNYPDQLQRGKIQLQRHIKTQSDNKET